MTEKPGFCSKNHRVSSVPSRVVTLYSLPTWYWCHVRTAPFTDTSPEMRMWKYVRSISMSVLERTTVMRPLPSSQRCTSPQVRDEASERRSPASDSAAARARSNFPRSSACSAVSKPRPRRQGWTAVSRMTAGLDGGEDAGLALGFGQPTSPSF